MRRGPSFGMIIAMAFGLAAIVGLSIGAVWGLSQRGSTVAVTPLPAATPTPTPTPSPTTPSPTKTKPPIDGFPVLPETSQLELVDWSVGSWQVTNTAGIAGVQAKLRNRTRDDASGRFVLYVFAAGEPMAQLTASAIDVPGHRKVAITFTGTDRWRPGDKILVLEPGESE